jgi:four helix bundle protein
MKENVVARKSEEFAIKVVQVYQKLIENKREFVLSKQFLRSGTSIGANVAESEGAISKAEFSLKISIAYKEALETKYWINLMNKTGYLDEELAEDLIYDADELSKILFSIIKTTRINKQ